FLAQLELRKAGCVRPYARQCLRVGHLYPVTVVTASRDKDAVGRLGRPLFECVRHTRGVAAQVSGRLQQDRTIRARLRGDIETVRFPVEVGGHAQVPRLSPKAFIAFCFRMRSWTSGLKSAALKSSIQRSGVISGKSDPNSILCL